MRCSLAEYPLNELAAPRCLVLQTRNQPITFPSPALQGSKTMNFKDYPKLRWIAWPSHVPGCYPATDGRGAYAVVSLRWSSRRSAIPLAYRGSTYADSQVARFSLLAADSRNPRRHRVSLDAAYVASRPGRARPEFTLDGDHHAASEGGGPPISR